MLKRLFSHQVVLASVCIFLQNVFHNCLAQSSNIKDHLLLHVPFDGDDNKSIKIINYGDRSFNFVPSAGNTIENSTRIYTQNDVLKINKSTKDSLILKEISHFPLTITFWLRIHTINPADRVISLANLDFGKFKLNLREQRGTVGKSSLFVLRMFRPKESTNETQVELKLNTEDWQLFTIQIDEQGLLKFAISNTIIDRGGTSLLTVANPLVTYSAPNLNVSDVFGKPEKPIDFSLAIHPKLYKRDIYVDDIRVYDKILSKEELNAIASNDPYLSAYIGKYQLAYTYKQIGDQYYLKASDVNRAATPDPILIDSARHYYRMARDAMLFWVDRSTGEGQALYNRLQNFQFASVSSMDSLSNDLKRSDNKVRNSLPIANSYDLLLFDLNYRIKLLESGYSFWGKDFTEKPLFPVQEYQFFTDTYLKFNATYQKIETLLKFQGVMDEKQEINELQSQLAAHRSEIERVKIDETQFKVGFYDQQLGNVKARLSGIEDRQKYLTREVERKEKELKSLDAKIMSQLSGAISQATLGVSIDVTKDLKSTLTQAGLTYLAGDNDLSKSLLGSYKDVYDVAVTAKEYYKKGKDVFQTIKSVAEGNITVDNVLKIGDAVANSGFVNEGWAKEWEKMKGTYHDIQTQYEKGKELLQKIEMTAKNPNMKDIVDFVDWMAQSAYIPDNYRKEYQQFKEYRQAAYSAVKDKRYDDILNLGLKMVNDQNLTAEVNRIRVKVKELKPAFVILQMIKNQNYEAIKDIIIRAILDGTVDLFLDEKTKNGYLYKILKQYMAKSTAAQSQLDAIFETLFNESPEAILECFPFAVKEDMYKLFGVETYQEIIGKLKIFKFSNYTGRIRVHHDTLYIFEEPYVMEISKYLAVDKESIRTVVKLVNTYASLYNELKTATTPLELYKIFEKMLEDDLKSQANVNDFFDLLNRKFSTPQRDAIVEEAVKFYLGNGVFQASLDPNIPNNQMGKIPNLVDPDNPAEVAGENMGAMPEGDNSAMMRQMAAKALDMAFPGVGTAINTVLNIADAIFSGYQIVDELRGIYQEKVDLNKEYVKLMDNLRDDEFNKQIALYETRISNISYDITLQEHEGFSKLVNNIVGRKKDLRRKISGHLPLLFFYAERLRYYYQRLNKSSIFWYGEGNSLNKIIFADPNNLRLAIDPDIKLYDWITTPDVTSSREDLFRLFSYWSRIHSLITDGITSNKLKYGENVAEISYQVFDLEKVNSTQWKDFQRWKRNPNLNFSYDLDLSDPLSSHNPFGFDSSYTSIKCVQVIPVAIGSNGQKIHNLITVSNMGLSTNEAGIAEPLMRKSRSSGDEFLDLDKDNNVIIPTRYISSLKYRWDSPNSDYQPFNFEGYNLRSDWKITVNPRADAANIDKVYFIVVYQFTKDYSKLQSTFPVQFMYKVTLPYNTARGTSETLNVTLPINPTLYNPTQQYAGLIKKYPYLSGRVQPNNLNPYLNNNIPIIVNNAADGDLRFSKQVTPTATKKKCFLKRLFN